MGDRLRAVDEYLESLPDDRRQALATVRELIHRRVPEVSEDWRYNMPVFVLGDMLCGIKSQKNYISLYMDVDMVGRYRDELAPLDCGKGCIRFKRLEQLPLGTVEKILDGTVEKLG